MTDAACDKPERLCGVMVDKRLADIEPGAYRFLDRGAERTRLAEMPRVGDTA